MINALRSRLFTLHYSYVNPTLRQRAQGLVVMIWAAIAFIIAFIGLRALMTLMNLSNAALIVPPELVIGALVLLATYALIQRGRLDAAIWLFIGLMLVPFVLATVIAVDAAAPVVLILPLIAAGLLLNRRSVAPILVIFALAMILRAVNQSGTTDAISYVPANNTISELISYAIVFGLSAIFLLVFSGSLDRIVAVSFSDVEQLKAAGRFSAGLEAQADERAILTRLLELIGHDLGFDLVQIYLPDGEGGYARRMRGGLGQIEMGARVTLRSGDEAVINEAILTREPVITTMRDALVRSEHLIAPAHESVTLALAYGAQVFGALDVQSERRDLFTENTIAGLQNLAAQASREVAQARRSAELERNVRDQEAIISRFLNQMSELQRRSEGTAAAGWTRYLQGRGQAGFGFDYKPGSIVASSDLPEQIRRAVQAGDVYIEAREGEQIVNVPITLRDQVLGVLTYSLPPERTISERETDMLRTVANRLGVALESNRLLEQTQAQAQRERKASEIGNLLLGETDIEAVLDVAAQNFNEALGAIHTRVTLEPKILSGEAQP